MSQPTLWSRCLRQLEADVTATQDDQVAGEVDALVAALHEAIRMFR